MTKLEKHYAEQRISRLASRLMKQRIQFSEGRVGQVSITKEIRKQVPVVTMREAYLCGLPPINMAGDIVVHSLVSDEDGVWMTDMPCELVQMHRELAIHAKGRVLIGGLGLGILVRMASLKASVKEVVVVERSADVIGLVGPYIASTKVSIVHCWQETTMLFQVESMLYRCVSLPDSYDFCSYTTCHYYAFQQAIRQSSVQVPIISDPRDFQALFAIEQANRENAELQVRVRDFLLTVGSPSWERIYGKHWDSAISVREEVA